MVFQGLPRSLVAFEPKMGGNIAEPHHGSPWQQAAPLPNRLLCFFCFFFLGGKERHAYNRQRKAATQECKISARAPSLRRRAGKEAYDRAARAHT